MDRTREPSASLTIVGRHEQLRVPSLNIGGWYDVFLADTITNFQHMYHNGVPTKLLIGPWSHASQRNPVGERSFGFAAQAGLIDLKQDLGSWQRRWFDHWLKGRDTGMLTEAPIKLFVMGTNIDLWATSNVFRTGHRIGLQITSSSFPRWDRNPNTGAAFAADAAAQVAHQTILHDTEHPSHVILPLV